MKSGSFRMTPGAAQADDSLRHGELGYDAAAAVARRRVRHRDPRAGRGQCAEHAVEGLAERRCVDVADRGDLEAVAGQHLAGK